MELKKIKFRKNLFFVLLVSGVVLDIVSIIFDYISLSMISVLIVCIYFYFSYKKKYIKALEEQSISDYLNHHSKE